MSLSITGGGAGVAFLNIGYWSTRVSNERAPVPQDADPGTTWLYNRWAGRYGLTSIAFGIFVLLLIYGVVVTVFRNAFHYLIHSTRADDDPFCCVLDVLTAGALGREVPARLLATADEVIEQDADCCDYSQPLFSDFRRRADIW
jgi:hypothetical protein